MSANEEEMPPVGFISAAEYRDAMEQSYYVDGHRVWADAVRSKQSAEAFAAGISALGRAISSILREVLGDS